MVAAGGPAELVGMAGAVTDGTATDGTAGADGAVGTDGATGAAGTGRCSTTTTMMTAIRMMTFRITMSAIGMRRFVGVGAASVAAGGAGVVGTTGAAA